MLKKVSTYRSSLNESKMNEGKKKELELPNSNLYFRGIKMDRNGNKVAMFMLPHNEKTFTIQTLDNLKYVHSLSKDDWMDADLKKVEKDAVEYIKEFGSKVQKSKLKTYGSLKESIYSDEIATKLGLRSSEVEKFIKKHNIDDSEFMQLVGQKKMPLGDVVTAIVGSDGNSYSKKLKSMLKESVVNEGLSSSDKKYYQKHKKELRALLDDDIFLSIEDAISIHKTGKVTQKTADGIKKWNDKQKEIGLRESNENFFSVGDEVMIHSDNDNDDYDEFRDELLIITHSTTSGRAYDKSMYPMPLYDLETESGEEVPFSLYSYELESY